MDYTQILYDVSDHVATITLNRPEQLNAFTTHDDARDDRRLRPHRRRRRRAGRDRDRRRSRVLRRSRPVGGGAPSTGGGSDERTAASRRDGGGLVSLRIFECMKPVIAAINGPAVGVGITMTLPMDIRLASTSAKIGFVFARRGIVPEACSSWFLPRLVGISQALEWCYTGRVFAADEALAGGLVRSAHQPDDLLPAARSIAAEIVDTRRPSASP